MSIGCAAAVFDSPSLQGTEISAEVVSLITKIAPRRGGRGASGDRGATTAIYHQKCAAKQAQERY